MNEVNFMTNEEVQTDDIARIIRTSYSLSPCTSDAAKAIYNARYRKIDDDCAVITKAELKQYKVQAVKEFADELKAMCSDYLYDTNFDGKNDFDIHICELSRIIDELLKEYEK